MPGWCFVLFRFLNHLGNLDAVSLTELGEKICISGKLKEITLLPGFIFIIFPFFFPMKETCPTTFKSLPLQRTKIASLFHSNEVVITLMKYRIKLLLFCLWFHLLI